MTPAKQIGWGGVALGFLAFFIAVPPITVRTPIPIALVGLLAMTAGLLAVRGGEKRLGWGGINDGRGAALAGQADAGRGTLWRAAPPRCCPGTGRARRACCRRGRPGAAGEPAAAR